MNPLAWKREHQVALGIAALIGGAIGWFYGLDVVYPNGHATYSVFCSGVYHNESCWYLTPGYWVDVTLWAIFGAAVLTGVVYVWRLLQH